MPVEFTQYMRPDGRPVPVVIDLGPDADEMAKAVTETGLRFEIEVLMTNQVSATLTCDDADLEFDIGPNDDTIPDRMRALVKKAFDGLEGYLSTAAELAAQ